MSNQSTLFQAECASAYEGEGVWDAIRSLRRAVSKYAPIADDLTRVVAASLADTVTEVTDNPASLYGIYVKSPAGASNDVKIQVFNTADTGVTLGTTAPYEVYHCEATKGRFIRFYPGGDALVTFPTAVSVAATTTHDGNTAPAAADQPTVWAFYSAA